MLPALRSGISACPTRLLPTLCRPAIYYSWRYIAKQSARPQSNVGEFRRYFATAESEKHASVVGTVPYHTSYTLLKHPKPPSTYPPRLDAGFSPLGRNLMVEAVRRKGNLNFWWDGKKEGSQVMGHEKPNDIEEYPFVTFYAPKAPDPDSHLGVGIRTGIVNSSQGPESFFDLSNQSAIQPWNEKHGVHLFVCTHGSRDCKCADRGQPLVNTLREELSTRRKQDGEESVWSRFSVGEVGHIGGHKYAPNLLVFPFGDWLAQLTPHHVPLVLDAISVRLRFLALARSTSKIGKVVDAARKELTSPLLLHESIWRGRMGLTKVEQTHLFEKFAAIAGV